MSAVLENLWLQEELLLIALHDEKGTLHNQASMLPYPLGAALLTELLLAERIALSADKRPFVEITSDAPLNHQLIDECLVRIAESRKRARVDAWVNRFAGVKNLRHRVAVDLCRLGVLTEDEDRVLWLFKRRLYPQRDERVEQALIARLERAIFEDGELDSRTALLISLADSADLLKIPFNRKRLKGRKQRIKAINAGEPLGAASRAAIEAVHAAIVASTAATMIATTAATS